MNVILLEKVGKLGGVGDIANVKAGYARNFLFPTGIALPATKKNLEHFEERRSELMAAHNAKMAEAQKRAKKIHGMRMVIEVNAGEEGKLFGSVGTKDISDAINAQGGETSKSEINLPHGVIREIGEYEILVDFNYDVTETITLTVAPVPGSVAAQVQEEQREQEVRAEEARAEDAEAEEAAAEEASADDVSSDEGSSDEGSSEETPVEDAAGDESDDQDKG